MVEAAIVLPVLIVILIGATYLRELYLARAAVRLAARSCAWAYALEGCTGGDPAACDTRLESAHAGELPQIAAATQRRMSNAGDPFRDVPIVRDALAGLFGEATHAQSSASVPFPLDDQRVGVARADNVVVCNSIPIDVRDIAEELLCDHLPVCP